MSDGSGVEDVARHVSCLLHPEGARVPPDGAGVARLSPGLAVEVGVSGEKSSRLTGRYLAAAPGPGQCQYGVEAGAHCREQILGPAQPLVVVLGPVVSGGNTSADLNPAASSC